MAGSFVVALAGAQSSGKTTLARALASRTGAAYVGFGDLVRARAAELGLKGSRQALQRLGQTLLNDLGPGEFCRLAMSEAGVEARALPVVWDGLRHPEVLAALRALYAPAPVRLVALAPDEAARRERVRQSAASVAQARAWEAHETENHLAWLKEHSDLVVNTATPELALSEILQLLA